MHPRPDHGAIAAVCDPAEMDERPSRPRRGSGFLVAAALVPLALLAAACSSGTDGSAASNSAGTSVSQEVRPFSEVQASDVVFEADPTDPARGIFRVTTTEPMICSIVWGETPALGRFNNSLAMNGTGIVQHDVFLPGAEPGRTYWYQLQGSAADGTLYRSEPATFTIPADGGAATATTTTVPGTDLAVGATIAEVSSEFGSNFAATNAIDGSGTTEWSSRGDGDAAFITADLGSTADVSGFAFITRSMADGTAITRTYTVTVDDGTTYGPFPAGTAADQRVAPVETRGRRFRFDVDTSTGGNVGAVEIRVLGPPR